MEGFLSTYCSQNEEGHYCFESDFNYFIFNLKNEEFKEHLYVKENNLVRFYSQLFASTLVFLEEEDYSDEDTDNFESFMDEEEDTEDEEDTEYLNENKILFFIPSKWDQKVKSMLTDHKIVDIAFKNLLPEKFISHYNLTFKNRPKKTILFSDRGRYSLSFFKFYKEDRECDLEETIQAVRRLKQDVKGWNVDSFYKFSVGNIPTNLGILEKATVNKCDDPISRHYSLWKLPNKANYEILLDSFKTFDFN